MDFVALDFETANAFRGSPCAVGLTRVRHGRAVDQIHQLMRPPEGVDRFDGFNTSIHGITARDVTGEPRFGDVWPELLNFIGPHTVVAHNAAFDIGVIRDACTVSELPWPTLQYACTLVLARRTYRLLSYGLPYAAAEAGHDFRDHHRADADSAAAAAVLLDIATRHEAVTLEELAATTGVALGWLTPQDWSGCHKRSTSSGPGGRPPSANPDADPHHLLYGEHVVFTGTLLTMTRDAAWEAVAKVGAVAERGATKRTTILVVGQQDPRRFSPGAVLSGKAARVAAMQAKGRDIEIMTEPELLSLLDDPTASGIRDG